MEFERIGKLYSPKKVTTMDYLQEQYPSDLSMYLEFPTEQIFIEEFQEIAVERVKLFRILETASLKNIEGMTFKDLVIDELSKNKVKYFTPLVRGFADVETRRRDYLSHFVLKLHYCQSEELRRWFLSRELEFFRLKFSNMLKKEDVLLFMKKNDLNFQPILDEEKKALAVDLYNSTAKNIILDSTNIYKVPFTQVLDLIHSRKVFVKTGNAYVPQMDLISILSSIFRSKLSHSLAIFAANITYLESDERISRVLKGLHTSYTGNDYCIKSKDQISLNALDALSVKSFPLCMRAMHETFKTTHHLKYMARLQYGLFLKGIGVTLEDSLKFWKDGFTQKPDIDSDIFEKRYAYNIRHSYGTEGKRVNYTPHSCMRIINNSVGPGENHGCPFKHYDANVLRQKLLSYNLSIVDVSSVMDYVAKGHFQLACTKYFEITHNIGNAKGINHPNLYFEESQNILVGKVNDNVKKPEKTVNAGVSRMSVDWGEDSAFDLDISSLVNSTENKNE